MGRPPEPRGVAFEQLQGHAAYHRQVLCGAVVANATAVFTKTHIETPMEVILHPPMLAHGMSGAPAPWAGGC